MKHKLMITFMLSACILIQCNEGNKPKSDQVGNKKINIVKGDGVVHIGEMIWMSNNLDVDTFRNGDPIPEAKTDEAWKKARSERKPAWCYFENDPANGNKYGKLYNWYAATDPRGLAPEGWHVPSDTEWATLVNYLGGKEGSGMKLKSDKGWNGKGNGNNISGFNALPGGGRFNNGSYVYLGEYGAYWSTTASDEDNAWFRLLGSNSEDVNRYDFSKAKGMSIRCIKD